MNKIFITALTLLLVIGCQQKEVAVTEDINTKDSTKTVKETITKGCTKDAKVCPDGNSVIRNPENNCEFNPCPVEAVKDDALARKKAAKEPMMCTSDAKECADGSFVGRDHHNNCKFKDCPSGEKTKEVM